MKINPKMPACQRCMAALLKQSNKQRRLLKLLIEERELQKVMDTHVKEWESAGKGKWRLRSKKKNGPVDTWEFTVKAPKKK
jgi:hypothetical protein